MVIDTAFNFEKADEIFKMPLEAVYDRTIKILDMLRKKDPYYKELDQNYTALREIVLNERLEGVGGIVEKIPARVNEELLGIENKVMRRRMDRVTKMLLKEGLEGYKKKVIDQLELMLNCVLSKTMVKKVVKKGIKEPDKKYPLIEKHKKGLLNEIEKRAFKDYMKLDLLTSFCGYDKSLIDPDTEYDGYNKNLVDATRFKYYAERIMVDELWKRFKNEKITPESYNEHIKNNLLDLTTFLDTMAKPSNKILELMRTQNFEVNESTAVDTLVESAGEAVSIGEAFLNVLTWGGSRKIIKGLVKGLPLKTLVSVYTEVVIDLYSEYVLHNRAKGLYPKEYERAIDSRKTTK